MLLLLISIGQYVCCQQVVLIVAGLCMRADLHELCSLTAHVICTAKALLASSATACFKIAAHTLCAFFVFL